jgi:hypothetical protein
LFLYKNNPFYGLPQNRQLRKTITTLLTKSITTVSIAILPPLIEPYTLKAQKSTVDVPEAKPIESPLVTVESSTLGTLESTVDTLEALLANVIEAPPMESTSTLLKL